MRVKQKARPVIGLTADTNEGQETSHPHFKGQTIYWIKKYYIQAVIQSGGAPIIIPVIADLPEMDSYLGMIDGLLVTGGFFDIHPELYGEKPDPCLGPVKPERTKMELELVKAAERARLPILGICGGLQVINVAFGGTLYQDIASQLPGALKHEQKPIPPDEPSHTVHVKEDSLLLRVTGRDELGVNSTHHQAVRTVGRGLIPCAVAPDGVTEAVEREGAGSFLIGVQWHPEMLYAHDEASVKLLDAFIDKSRKFGSSHR